MDPIAQFFADFPWWGWFALAGALLILEVFAPSTLLLWPAISAGLTGLAAVSPFQPHWGYEIVQFALGTIVLTFAGPKFIRRMGWNRSSGPDLGLNAPLQRLIGETGEVISVGGNGLRIEAGSGAWGARLEAGSGPVKKGDLVEIVAVDRGAPVVRAKRM